MNLIINVICRFYVFLTLLTLTLITTLSLWPVAQLPEVPGTDKTHHFIAYGLLMLPVALKRPKYWLVITIIFAIFSGMIELVQPYVNRYGEWLDLVANVAGLICGMVCAGLMKYFASKNKNSIGPE